MSDRSEDHVDFTAEELTAIALLAGRRRFPGVGSFSSSPQDAAQREAVLRAARLSLVARGLVSLDAEGHIGLTEAHGPLFRAALAPAMFVSAHHQTRDRAEVRLYLARPELAVEHRSLAPGIDRLTPFEPAGVFEQLVAFLVLENRPATNGEPMTVDAAALAHLRGAAEKAPYGDRPELSEALHRLGDAYLSTSTVRLMHGRRRLRGGELAWIDAGEEGLWQLNFQVSEPAAPSTRGSMPVILRPSSAAAIADELLSFFPSLP